MYLSPTNEQGRALLLRGIEGPVTMLNLIRLREVADYSEYPELAPVSPISGREAYDLYMAHTEPFLEAEGGSLTLLADGGEWFIGPDNERWDLVLLVRHAGIAAFMSMATNDSYLAGMGHRSAATADSRLLPILPREG